MEMGVKPVIDEEKILRDGKSLIEREFGCEVIINGEDKGNKKRQAIPYRVAIYLE